MHDNGVVTIPHYDDDDEYHDYQNDDHGHDYHHDDHDYDDDCAGTSQEPIRW